MSSARAARAAAVLLAAVLAGSASARQGEDAGAVARGILEARCASCHAPDSEDRAAQRRLPDVLDLPALRARWIGPEEPEATELWLSITDPFEPMPPPDASTGPLTPAERFVLREWIARGAPDPLEAPPVRAAPAATAASRLGRLHPLSVHFPIALLMAAALAELLAGARGRAEPLAARRFLVRLGALGAVVAAVLGWLSASSQRASATLELHRWLGVSTALLALVALVASERASRPGRGRRALLVALLGCAALAGAAGWYGGILVFGPPSSGF